VTPREEELLTGMGNCFAACHADFDDTLEMVSSSRGRTAEDVRAELGRMRSMYRGDPVYERLRSRLPAEFPC
jgi:hypothetical protein